MEKFALINKARSTIKVFESFEESSKNSSMINLILISYGCIFKRSSKPVIKGSRIESIEDAQNEYKNYYRKGGEDLLDSIVFFKNGV